MKAFRNRIAVVTGGGGGIGRALVAGLLAEGCRVATCDVSSEGLAETERLVALPSEGDAARLMTCIADVSREEDLIRFRDEIAARFGTESIHILVNNAGVVGGGSFVIAPRAEWERTFEICWRGVYLGTRVFLPLLLAADEGHIVNISSVNGLWASAGPSIPHTAYCTAKFAIRGFTEALITDLRVNAPHIHCSVALPGHVGTSIMTNSRVIHDGMSGEDMVAAAAVIRQHYERIGRSVATLSDAELFELASADAQRFIDNAPTTADSAARTIIEAMRAGEWRILIGEDARLIDLEVRNSPETAYDRDFSHLIAAALESSHVL